MPSVRAFTVIVPEFETPPEMLLAAPAPVAMNIPTLVIPPLIVIVPALPIPPLSVLPSNSMPRALLVLLAVIVPALVTPPVIVVV
jgi:hypothetical protein